MVILLKQRVGLRIWLIQRSHQSGWQSIWSATPGFLDIMRTVNEISLKATHGNPTSYRTRRSLGGQVPTEQNTWNLKSLMPSLPHGQRSRVINAVPDASKKKKSLKKMSNTHRQLSSNSGVPTHPSIQPFPPRQSPWVIQSQLWGMGSPAACRVCKNIFEYFRSAKYLVKE